MANVNVASYNKKYLKMSSAVTQIYDDLEAYHDFIRMQYPQVRFNESDLYNNRSVLWQKFDRQRNRKARQA